MPSNESNYVRADKQKYGLKIESLERWKTMDIKMWRQQIKQINHISWRTQLKSGSRNVTNLVYLIDLTWKKY